MGTLEAGTGYVTVQRLKYNINSANGGQYLIVATALAEASINLN